MDPDPEFWPNLDPDPGLPYVINLKEKINLENYKKIMSPEEIFSQISL